MCVFMFVFMKILCMYVYYFWMCICICDWRDVCMFIMCMLIYVCVCVHALSQITHNNRRDMFLSFAYMTPLRVVTIFSGDAAASVSQHCMQLMGWIICTWRDVCMFIMCMLIYVCVCTCVYVYVCFCVPFCMKTNV